MTVVKDYNGDLNEFLQNYAYPQPELTEYLDNIQNEDFDQHMINKIVLWKVNRYVKIEDSILNEINSLKELSNGQHRRSGSLLEKMMNIRGADLPMASTILRFRNPNVFQIIDKHAYRAIYDKKCPSQKNCTKRKSGIRYIKSYPYEKERNEMTEKMKTKQGKEIYKLRDIAVEPSFGDIKENKGM